MYGKIFQSTFTGSMYGAGPEVFSVWSYVIASTVAGTVELNPILLGHAIGMPTEAVEAAIEKLCAPDPRSRNKDFEGRRLIREGEFQYVVPSHETYREMRSEDARREYQRQWIKNKRDKEKRPVTDRVDIDSCRHDLDESTPACVSVSAPSGLVSSLRDPDQTRSMDDANLDPCDLRPGKVTGHELRRLFGAIREREIGGLAWHAPRDLTGKATDLAEAINGDPAARADVAATMVLLLRKAKAGQAGSRSADILREHAFAFGTWCARFTALREEIHGLAPEAAPPAVGGVESGHYDQQVISRINGPEAL